MRSSQLQLEILERPDVRHVYKQFVFPLAQQPNAGQGRLILKFPDHT
jgi:hypothetical protein